MPAPSPSAGVFFAQAFERQCRDALSRKLAAVSSFKKALAGITNVSDAQAKGYAPSEAQIAAIASSIEMAANSCYASAGFCGLSGEKAAQTLVQSLHTHVSQMNDQWRTSGQFAFSADDLSDMMDEARGMIAAKHSDLA